MARTSSKKTEKVQRSKITSFFKPAAALVASVSSAVVTKKRKQSITSIQHVKINRKRVKTIDVDASDAGDIAYSPVIDVDASEDGLEDVSEDVYMEDLERGKGKESTSTVATIRDKENEDVVMIDSQGEYYLFHGVTNSDRISDTAPPRRTRKAKIHFITKVGPDAEVMIF